MSQTEDEDRALRMSLGVGARSDDPAAPARELAWARSGTAYFARKLNDLADDQLDEPSLLPGWTRGALVAHVGYNAQALIRLTEWAATGVETPMYASPEQRNAEIERGSHLPARVLRDLFAHSEIRLDTRWSDLSAAAWDAEVVTAQWRTVPARETAWMRAREVWVHAVDLNNDGSYLDFPPMLLDELVVEVLQSWARRSEDVDLILAPTDRDGTHTVGTGSGPIVFGSSAGLARWLTGRGESHLTSSTGTVPTIPRWI